MYTVLIILYKKEFLSGLIACRFGLDPYVLWCGFGFDSPFSGNTYPAFILLPLAIIVHAIGTGALLRRVSPRIYSLLTGGRGFRRLNNGLPELQPSIYNKCKLIVKY